MSAPTIDRPGVRVPQRDAEADLHLAFIDQTKDARDAAKLAAEERLTDNLNQGGKIKRFLKGIWQGTMFREFLVHKYTDQELTKIEDSGNVLARETNDVVAARQSQLATIERFQSEYDEALHEEAGEHRDKVEDNAELTTEVKDLIRQNVEGNLSDEAMREEATRLIAAWRDQHPDRAAEGRVRIDNMIEIAQAVRGRITHDRSIDAVLEGMKITVGESRSGVRTEVKFNKYEQIVDKIQNTRAGAWASSIIGPETVGIVSAVAVIGLRVGSHSVLKAAFGTLAGAVTGGVWAGLRENKIVKEERSQHHRERAQGKQFEDGSERRVEMEETRYESSTASELAERLRGHYNSEGQIQDIAAMINSLAEVETRIKMSDGEKIDLITYSDVTRIEEERLALDIARAQAKVGVEQQIDPSMKRMLAQLLHLDEDASLSDILAAQASGYIEGIREDISAKDEAFNKLRRRRVKNAVVAGAVTGLVFGLATQEAVAGLDDTRHGLIDNLTGQGTQPINGLEHKTLLQGAFDRAQEALGIDQAPGEVAVHHDPSGTYDTHGVGERGEFSLSNDHTIVENGDGTVDFVDPSGKVTVDNLPVNPDGSLPQSSIDILHQHQMTVEDLSHNEPKVTKDTEQVSLKEYLQNHKDDTTRIKRDLWYDNNTAAPNFDKNELGLWWGGQDNMGVGKDDSFRFTVQGMTENGSYHGDQSINWEQAAEKGKIQLAISASGDTQARPFLVDVDKNGNAVISKDSPAAQFFSVDKDGHAVFHGKYVEVVQMMGDDSKGVEHVNVMATHVGEDNVKNLQDEIVKTTSVRHFEYKITTSGYDTVEAAPVPTPDFIEAAPVIPIISRRAMEGLRPNPETPLPYYNGYSVERMSAEELREFERTLSPRLRENPDVDLKPGEEFAWYREQAASVEGRQYVDDIDSLVEASPELRGLTSELESMIMIPVKATGEAESKNIYDLLKTYAQQNSEALKKNMMLLHVNWFKDAESDPAQFALIQQTQREIERAKADFPELKVATIESQWSDEQRRGGVIGHVARRMNDAAIFALQRAIEEGRISDDHDVLMIRNDADPKGISKNYLGNYVKSFEANSETDVFTGTTRFDNRKASELPGLVFAANFMQSINLIASAREKRVHTGGANFGVRASTFAAVSSAASRESWTGAGSDDVMIGRRIAAARNRERKQTYQGKGIAGYFEKLKAKRSKTTSYSQADEPKSNRKVGTVVFGAQIDTDSDRQEALYLQGVPIVHSWDGQYGFDDGGHKDRSEDLNSPEMKTLKQQAANDEPGVLLERMRHDMEGSINNMGATSSVIDTALSMTFAGMKKGVGQGYILHSKPGGGFTLEFTDSGMDYLKTRLTRDGRGRFDPYGARLARQLYGQVRPGSRRQRVGAPLVSIS